MGYWITPDAVYHEGKRLPGDIAVPQQPTPWHEWIDGAWVPNLRRAQGDLRCTVDFAAGTVRAKYASPGEFIADEYAQAEQQARDFQGAKYAGTVPPMVQDWLDNNTSGLATPQQAADDIINQATFMHTKLEAIRTARLAGKKNVTDAMTIADAIAAKDAALAAMAAL